MGLETRALFPRVHAMPEGGMIDPARDNMAGHVYHASCVNEADRSHLACSPGLCCVRLTTRPAVLRDLDRHMIDYLAAINYSLLAAHVSLPLPQAWSGAGQRPGRASSTRQQSIEPVRGRMAHRTRAEPRTVQQAHTADGEILVPRGPPPRDLLRRPP